MNNLAEIIIILLLGVCTSYYFVKSTSFKKTYIYLSSAILMGVIVYIYLVSKERYGINGYTLSLIFLVYGLGVLSIHDLYSKMLPLDFIFFGIGFSLIILLLNPNMRILDYFISPLVFGGALFGASKLFRGGIGQGDAYAFSFISTLVGWKMTLSILLISVVLSGIFGFVLLITKKAKRKSTMAFMPFALLATIFILCI